MTTSWPRRVAFARIVIYIYFFALKMNKKTGSLKHQVALLLDRRHILATYFANYIIRSSDDKHWLFYYYSCVLKNFCLEISCHQGFLS